MLRVKLVKPSLEYDFCEKLKIFDHEYLLIEKEWKEITSDYKTEQEDNAARVRKILKNACFIR